MKKPMIDFVTRGGLGELLAAATDAMERLMNHWRVPSISERNHQDGIAIERLRQAITDGEDACEAEAEAQYVRIVQENEPRGIV